MSKVNDIVSDIFNAASDRIFALRHPATSALVEELWSAYANLHYSVSVEKIENAVNAGADVNSERHAWPPLVTCTNLFAHAAWMAEPDNQSSIGVNGHTVTKEEWQEMADQCLAVAKILIDAGANPCDRKWAAKPLWHLKDRSRVDQSSESYKKFETLLVEAEKRWQKETPAQAFVRKPKP